MSAPSYTPWSTDDRRDMARDEYDEPGIAIGKELPGVGFVSVASVVMGCEEAKALGTQEEIAKRIVDALNGVPSETGLLDTYVAKVERDTATIRALRDKLIELCDRLGWQGPSRESNIEITVREARAMVAEHDRIAAGVAFVTDTRLGGE